MVNEIKLQATTALKQEIVRKTNEKLHRVIVDDYVEIESIDRYIKLRVGTVPAKVKLLALPTVSWALFSKILSWNFRSLSTRLPARWISKTAGCCRYHSFGIQSDDCLCSVSRSGAFADRFYANPDSQYLTVVASPQDQAVVVYEGIDFFDSYQREHKGDEK